jgi:putative molybdopterin biosynthesis protein
MAVSIRRNHSNERPHLDKPDESTTTQFLTTKEVADLLRVKERKIYDLAGAGEIPHRRITGRLLFPKAEITAWIEGSGNPVPAKRPAVIAGSHDPLLDWAIRESGCGLATLFDGSSNGLERFGAGEAALCGMHIPEDDGWNIATVSAHSLTDCVLISWAQRVQGFIVPPGTEENIGGFGDLPGHKMILRQPGAGARELFKRLSASHDLSGLEILPAAARTETDAAQAVSSGEADVAIGLEAAARQFRLGFVPIVQERFDLLVNRRSYFTEPVQALMAFADSDAIASKANSLGGYDLSESGKVRWLSD